MHSIKPKKGTKKLINAWAFYDWANSVYSLVITTAIFPLYYAALFVENNKIFFMGYQIKNTAMISFLTAFAFVIISLISPILAGIADFLGNKKRFMQFFVFLGSFSCIGLFWFNLDNIYYGLFLYFLASFLSWQDKKKGIIPINRYKNFIFKFTLLFSKIDI